MSHKAKPTESAAAPKLRIRARAVAAAPRPPLVPRTAAAPGGSSASSTAAATHATVAQRRASREQQRTQPPQRLSPKRSGGAKPASAPAGRKLSPASSSIHPLAAEIDAPPAGVTDAASWFAAVTRAAEQMRAKHAAASTDLHGARPEEEEKHQPAAAAADTATAHPRILPRHEPSLPAAPRSPPALKKSDSSQQRKSKAALRVSYSDEVQFAEARHAEDEASESSSHHDQQQHEQQHRAAFSLPITAAMRRDSEIGGAPTSRTAAREVYKMRYGRSKEEEAALAGVDLDEGHDHPNDDAETAARSPPQAKKKVPKRILSDEPTLGAARRRAAMKEMQALAGGAAPPVSRSSRTGLPLSPIAASPRISSDAGSSSSRASSARSSAKSSPNASFHAASSSPPRPQQHQPHPLSDSNAGADGTVDFTTMELKQLRDMNGTIDVFTSGEHPLRQSILRDSIPLSSSAAAAAAVATPAPASTSASFSASGSLSSSLDHLPLRSSAAEMIRRFREAPPKSKEQRAAEEAQLLQQQQQQQQADQSARSAAAAAVAPAVVTQQQPKRSIPWWMAEALASPFSSVSASNDSAALPGARASPTAPQQLTLSTIVASPDVSLGESSMEREWQHMVAAAETGEFNPRTNSILDSSVSLSTSQAAAAGNAEPLSTAEFNPRTNSILLGESSTNFMDTLRSHSSHGSAAGPEDASLASFERHVKDTLDSPAPAPPPETSANHSRAPNDEHQEEMLKTSDFSDFDNRHSGSGSSSGSSLFEAARRSRDAPGAAVTSFDRRRQPSSSMYDSGGDDDIALSHSQSDAGEDEARPLDDDDDEDGAEDLRRSRSAAASSHMLLDQTLASHIHSGLAMTLTSPSSVAHHAKAAASTSSTSPPTATAPASHAAKPSTDSVASGVSNISGVSGTTLKSLPPLLSAHDSSPQITARGVADSAAAEESSQFERRFVPPPERDAHLSVGAGSRSRSASGSAKHAFKRAAEHDDAAADGATPGLERIMSPDTQQVQDLSRFVRKSYTGSRDSQQQPQAVPAAAAAEPTSDPAVDQSIEEDLSLSQSADDESTEALKAEVRRSSQQQPQAADAQQQSKPSNDSSNVTPRTPLESTFVAASSAPKGEHEAGNLSDSYASSADEAEDEEEGEEYSSSPPQAVGASVHMKPLRGHRSAASGSAAAAASRDSHNSTQAGGSLGASTVGASAQLLPFSPPATAEPLPPLPAFPSGPMTCDLCHASSASSPSLSFVWCFDCRMKVCDPSPVPAPHEASFEDLSVVPSLPPSVKSCHLDLHAAGKVFASHRVTRITRGVTAEEGSASATTSSSRPEYERSTAANRSAPTPSPTADASLLKPPSLAVGGRSLSTPSPQPSSQSSSTSASISASSRDRTISAALQARGGFVEMVDANARMFAEVFNQQPAPPARAQSALSLREKERGTGSLTMKERQTSVGDESNRSFGSVEEEPSDDVSPRDRPSAPGSGSSSASDLTPRGSRGGRKQHRAHQSSASSASSIAHSQRRARLLGMTPSPPISPVAAGLAGKKFGEFASTEIKAAAALEAEIAGAAAATGAESSASPNDVIDEDLESSESPRDPLAHLGGLSTAPEQRPFMSPSALLTPSPSTLPPIAGASATVVSPAAPIIAPVSASAAASHSATRSSSWLPTSPPQHAPHHASYTKVAGAPSLAVGKAPYLHLTPRDLDDGDGDREERKYPAPASKHSGAAEAQDEEEDSTSGLNDSFIDRLLTKHHEAQKDEAKLASQPDAATLAQRAGIAAAAKASLTARETARARAISAAASTAPFCALCESAPGAVWCAGCRMYLCGTEQNNCDRDLHNQSDKMRSHTREAAALKMKRDKLQALRGDDDDDDDDDEEQAQEQSKDAKGSHSVFGNTTGIAVNSTVPSSVSSSQHEASPELKTLKQTGSAKRNPLHHSFSYPAEPAAPAVSANSLPSSQAPVAADASPSVVPSNLFTAALSPSPSPSPLPPRTGSAFLSFPLPADFGRDMRTGPRRSSPVAPPFGSAAVAQVVAPLSPPASQLSPSPPVAAALAPMSIAAARDAPTIEAVLSPSSASSATAAAAMFGSSSSSLPSMEELEAALHENERNMQRLGIAPAPAPTVSTKGSSANTQAVRDRDAVNEVDEADGASSSRLVSPKHPAQTRRQEPAPSTATPASAATVDESALDHSSDSWDTSVSSMSESLFASPPDVQPKLKTPSDVLATASSASVPGREHASVRSCARGVQFSLDAAMARFNAQVVPAPPAASAVGEQQVATAITEKQLQQDAALRRVEDMMQQLLTAQQKQQQQQQQPHVSSSAKSSVPSALAHLPPAAQQAVKAALRAAALSQQVNSQLTARPALSHRGHEAVSMPQSMGQSLNLSGSSRRASFAQHQQQPHSSQLASSTSKHATIAAAVAPGASSRRPSIPPLPLPAHHHGAPPARSSVHRAPPATAAVTVEDESVSPVVSTRRSSAPNIAAAPTTGVDRRHSTAVSVSQLNSRRSSLAGPATAAELPQQQPQPPQQQQQQQQQQQMLFIIEQQQARILEQQQLLEESRRSIQMHQLELRQSQSRVVAPDVAFHPAQSLRPQSMIHGAEVPASAEPLHLASSFSPRASMFAAPMQQLQPAGHLAQSQLSAAAHPLAASARAAPSDRPPIRGMFAARSMAVAVQQPQPSGPMQPSMQFRPHQQQPQQQQPSQAPQPRAAWGSEQQAPASAEIPLPAAADPFAPDASPLSLQPTYALLSHTLDESAKRRQQLERMMR